MTDKDDDFLARWSRRKSDSRRGLKRVDAPASQKTEGETQNAALKQEPLAPESGEPIDGLANASEPEPETAEPTAADAVEDDFSDVDFNALDYDSDYGRFMKDGVPEAIRRRALKQLYRSNPILANVDGLNDYDDDFTDAALAVEVLQSAYKVGRGYFTDEELAEMEDGDAEDLGAEEEAVVADSEEVAAREPKQADAGQAEKAGDHESALLDEEAGGDSDHEKSKV